MINKCLQYSILYMREFWGNNIDFCLRSYELGFKTCALQNHYLLMHGQHEILDFDVYSSVSFLSCIAVYSSRTGRLRFNSFYFSLCKDECYWVRSRVVSSTSRGPSINVVTSLRDSQFEFMLYSRKQQFQVSDIINHLDLEQEMSVFFILNC